MTLWVHILKDAIVGIKQNGKIFCQELKYFVEVVVFVSVVHDVRSYAKKFI